MSLYERLGDMIQLAKLNTYHLETSSHTEAGEQSIQPILRVYQDGVRTNAAIVIEIEKRFDHYKGLRMSDDDKEALKTFFGHE